MSIIKELSQQIFGKFNNQQLVEAMSFTNFPSNRMKHFLNIKEWMISNQGLLITEETYPYLVPDAWEKSKKNISLGEYLHLCVGLRRSYGEPFVSPYPEEAGISENTSLDEYLHLLSYGFADEEKKSNYIRTFFRPWLGSMKIETLEVYFELHKKIQLLKDCTDFRGAWCLGILITRTSLSFHSLHFDKNLFGYVGLDDNISLSKKLMKGNNQSLWFLEESQVRFLKDKFRIETFMQLCCLLPLKINFMYSSRLWDFEYPDKYLFGNVRGLSRIYVALEEVLSQNPKETVSHKLRKFYCPPSSANKLTNAKQLMEKEFRCFRAAQPSLPAHLAHPSFGIFMQEFLSPTMKYNGLIEDIMSSGSGGSQTIRKQLKNLLPVCNTEESRRAELFNIIRALFESVYAADEDVDRLLSTKPEENKLDISVLMMGNDTPILFCDTKNEAGTSGDIHLPQLITCVKQYYFSLKKGKESSANKKVHYAEYEYSSNVYYTAKIGDILPLLGLIMYGTHLQVFAIWLDSYEEMVVAAEPLTHAVDFSNMFSYSVVSFANGQHDILRVFHALQCSGKALMEHYHSLGTIITNDTKKNAEMVFSEFFENTVYDTDMELRKPEIKDENLQVVYYFQESLPYSPFPPLAPYISKQSESVATLENRKCIYNPRSLFETTVEKTTEKTIIMHLELVRALKEHRHGHMHNKFVYLAKLSAFSPQKNEKKRSIFEVDFMALQPPPKMVTPIKSARLTNVSDEGTFFGRVPRQRSSSQRQLLASSSSLTPSGSPVSSSGSSSIYSSQSATLDKMHRVSLIHATSNLITAANWQDTEEYFQQKIWDTTFLRELQVENSKSRIVTALVKYVSGDYSSNHGSYHDRAGKQNIGPKLISTAKLPGGISMIIMEYLAEKDGWITLEAFINSYDEHLQEFTYIKECLTNAVANLYNQFRNMMNSTASSSSSSIEADNTTIYLVHGDIRPVNIMINFECDVVQSLLCGDVIDAELVVPYIRLIDFDWCGIDGDAKYPSTISKKAFWPLRDNFPLRNRVITHEHDVEMIQALFISNYE